MTDAERLLKECRQEFIGWAQGDPTGQQWTLSMIKRIDSYLSSIESKEPTRAAELPEELIKRLREEQENIIRYRQSLGAEGDYLCQDAADLIERQQEQLKKFDPDPVVCSCREAICPHTPIAQLPRQELVNYYKQRLKDSEQDAQQRMERQQEQIRGLQEKYNELLYGVAQKHPGESRHETALRYILEHESRVSNGQTKAASRPQDGEGK